MRVVMARALLSRLECAGKSAADPSSKVRSLLSGTSSISGFKSTGRTLSSLPSTLSCLDTRRYKDNPTNTLRALQPLSVSRSRPYSSWNDGVSAAASGAADKMGGLDTSSIGSGITALAASDAVKMGGLDTSWIGSSITAFAEAWGVSVQSLLLGMAVAFAFAARKVIRTVLAWMSLSERFALGDTIKVGSTKGGSLNYYIEGQVVDMGLKTTSLLTADKYRVIVTNSLLQSQVIVNKSRAEEPAMLTKISLQSDDWDKIPQITNDIRNMLKVHPKVCMEKDEPYCLLSSVENSKAGLTIGCNLAQMSEDELYSAKNNIEREVYMIVQQHRAK